MKHRHQPVSIVTCCDYSPPAVQAAMERAVELLGGMSSFISPGMSVLIKPNLLSDRAPEEAVTTHPEVVRAAIRMVKAAGATPVVADSPANPSRLQSVWQKTGMLEVCQQENIELLALEGAGAQKCEMNGFTFNVAKPLLEADLILNLPKVKTHVLTVLTAGMKNLYGTLPGFQKAHLHKEYSPLTRFGELIAAIFERLPPGLTIADGIMGMEGEGPSAGRPCALGFLAASANALSLDMVLCEILNIQPQSVPYLKPFADDADVSRIPVLGATVGEVTPPSFALPSTLLTRILTGSALRWLGGLLWIRPRIESDCVMCGFCAESCPVSALVWQQGQRPFLRRKRCIGCCCCHEVCPAKAISMRQSPILRIAALRRRK